jgi:integrase
MGKRTHGEGSILKREDGRWAVHLSFGTNESGKRLRRSTTCRTQKEARETLKVWLKEREAGLDASERARSITVAQLMEDFLQLSQEKGLRPKTIENYEHLARVHIIPVLGKKEVRSLDSWTITRFLMTRKKVADKGTRVGTERLSPHTLRQTRMVLRRALDLARRRKVIATNPADDAEIPAHDRYEARSLTQDQAKTLLAALPEHPFGTFYLLMLGLGMRPGEVRGLKWSDVTFAETGGRIVIARQIQRVDGVFREVPVKTRKGNRWVALPGFVARALKQHQERQAEAIAAAETSGIVRPAAWSDLVFQNAEGNPVEERWVVQRFHDLTERLELPRMRLYDLRRSCVTFLHAMGVPPNVIKDIVGHSQISVTMDYYTDTHDTSREEAARILDAAFGNHSGAEGPPEGEGER